MSKSTFTSMVSCSRCGIKHSRPVGNRCKRILNISAPVVSDMQQDDQENISQQADQQASGSHHLSGACASSPGTGLKTSQVESELDLILKKMDELENKNHQLEMRLDACPHPSGTTSRLSHSSPKRSQTCFAQCDSKPTSSTLISQPSDSDVSVTQPSLQFFKEDDRTQLRTQNPEATTEIAYIDQATIPLRSKSHGPIITASWDKGGTCLSTRIPPPYRL